MTKERMIELIEKLNNEQIKALISGINQITCEYGWEHELGKTDLIKEAWEKN